VTEEVDVVVVGLGVGGEEVAGRLAEAGRDVIGIEGDLVGGECPYWGCIPSKMIVRASDLLAETARVDGIAGRAHAIPDWTPVADRIRDEATDDWNDSVAVKRFTDKGGRFVRGWATLTGPGEVDVDGTGFRARDGVVLATGSAPVVPPIDGLAGTPYWTNRQLIEAETLPDSLLVLGGGAIGLELAQALGRFGVEVHIVEASDRVISGEEPESSQLIEEILHSDGITVHLNATATAVEHDGRFTLTTSDQRRLVADQLLVSVGRRSRLDKLGVEKVGLDSSARALAVDERMRAGEKLWAVGDLTGHGVFTHMAMYQADIVVRDILGQGGPAADYRAVPRVTFTDPEIGAVGMTESQALQAGHSVKIGMARIPATTRGWIHKAGNAGFIKLVIDAERDVLLGATSAGPAGGEVLSMLTLAVKTNTPVATLRDMIYAYPTFHRGILDALHDLD